MLPFQQRVIDEKRELDTKIIALCVFIHSDEFNDLSYVDQANVDQQFKIMCDYSKVLHHRIRNFNLEETENVTN